jgi:hypothetical protein
VPPRVNETTPTAATSNTDDEEELARRGVEIRVMLASRAMVAIRARWGIRTDSAGVGTWGRPPWALKRLLEGNVERQHTSYRQDAEERLTPSSPSAVHQRGDEVTPARAARHPTPSPAEWKAIIAAELDKIEMAASQPIAPLPQPPRRGSRTR